VEASTLAWLLGAWTVVSWLLTLGIRVLALGVIPGNRKPSTGLAWLLLVLLAPFAGLVAFAFLGSQRLGRRRAARQRLAHDRIAESFADPDAEQPTVTPALAGVVRLNRRLGAIGLRTGTDVELIPDYADSLRRMAAAIDSAERYVHAEFYISARDEATAPVFDAMLAAHRRGVDVRFLFDHLGSRGIPGYRRFIDWLDASGFAYAAMLPIAPRKRRFRRPDLRNHRKLLVVDGQVGFMGSQNLIEPGYDKPANHQVGREWVDLMVRVNGPTVAALDAVFAADWYTELGEMIDVPPPPSAAGGTATQLVPSGPGFDAENNLRMFTSLIASATRRLSITSPYFVPDESLLYAVTTAAMRGVEVELFVSEEADQLMVGHAQSSYYRALLEAGVRIWRYPAPAILHAKHFTVDDEVAVVGSSNMDMRSFSLNYEISLMMLGAEIVERFVAVQDDYRARSSELTLQEWLERPRRLKYLDNVFRLTAALQ